MQVLTNHHSLGCEPCDGPAPTLPCPHARCSREPAQARMYKSLLFAVQEMHETSRHSLASSQNSSLHSEIRGPNHGTLLDRPSPHGRPGRGPTARHSRRPVTLRAGLHLARGPLGLLGPMRDGDYHTARY
ncbi:hypothetical protein HYQ46_011236 [Verticillium longisporum]|nr:hypothetical protein HYQ46_011236 [Verticillium longisporum]